MAYPPLENVLITNTDVVYVVIGFPSKFKIVNDICVLEGIWLFKNAGTES